MFIFAIFFCYPFHLKAGKISSGNWCDDCEWPEELSGCSPWWQCTGISAKRHQKQNKYIINLWDGDGERDMIRLFFFNLKNSIFETSHAGTKAPWIGALAPKTVWFFRELGLVLGHEFTWTVRVKSGSWESAIWKRHYRMCTNCCWYILWLGVWRLNVLYTDILF